MPKKKETPPEQMDVVQVARNQRHLHLLEKAKRKSVDPGSPPLSKAEIVELAAFEQESGEATPAGPTPEQIEKASMAEESIIDTQKQAARYAKVTPRTIRNWVNDGMPLTEDGRYIISMLDIWQASKGKQTSEMNLQKGSAELEIKTAKAQLMQIDLEIKQGKLIRLEDVERGRVERIQAVKLSLMMLPRKLPPILKGKPLKKQRDIIRKEIDHIIKVFSGGKDASNN